MIQFTIKPSRDGWWTYRDGVRVTQTPYMGEAIQRTQKECQETAIRENTAVELQIIVRVRKKPIVMRWTPESAQREVELGKRLQEKMQALAKNSRWVRRELEAEAQEQERIQQARKDDIRRN